MDNTPSCVAEQPANVSEPAAAYISTPTDAGQVWLASYSDCSGMAVFAREIDALRYAVARSMGVRPVNFGDDLIEAARHA